MKKRDLENLKWYQRSMRDNLWMLMGLIYSQPSAPAQVAAVETQSELEYLFSEPTGKSLDIVNTDELYLISNSDLEEVLEDFWNDNHNHHVEDDFGYDRLGTDLDFDADIW